MRASFTLLVTFSAVPIAMELVYVLPLLLTARRPFARFAYWWRGLGWILPLFVLWIVCALVIKLEFESWEELLVGCSVWVGIYILMTGVWNLLSVFRRRKPNQETPLPSVDDSSLMVGTDVRITFKFLITAIIGALAGCYLLGATRESPALLFVSMGLWTISAGCAFAAIAFSSSTLLKRVLGVTKRPIIDDKNA
jgi:hypothetical protein